MNEYEKGEAEREQARIESLERIQKINERCDKAIAITHIVFGVIFLVFFLLVIAGKI